MWERDQNFDGSSSNPWVKGVICSMIGWQPSGFGARMNKFPTCLFIGIKTYLNFFLSKQYFLLVNKWN
jgi:hypothetical protein